MQLFKEGPIPTAKITAQQKQVKVIICLIVNIQWNDNQCTVKLTNTLLRTLPTCFLVPSKKVLVFYQSQKSLSVIKDAPSSTAKVDFISI